MFHHKSSLLVLVSLALFSYTVAQDKNIWKEIFTMDCNGGIHILDSSLPIGSKLSFLNSTFNLAVDKIREAVNCKCAIPSMLSEIEFQRRFVPGVSAALNMALGPNKLVDDTDTCDLSNFAHTLDDINFFTFDLPSTCTLETWEAGNPCMLQYNMPLEFDASLQLAVDHCPNSYLPYISVTCSGNGCDNYLKPCSFDEDCGGSLKCNVLHTSTTSQFFSDMFSAFQDMYIYDSQDIYPGCYSISTAVDYISQTVLSYFTSTPASNLFSDFKVCGFDVSNFGSMDDDFTSCSVTQYPIDEECAYVDTLYSTTCPNIATWDGTLSDSSSAVSSSRKNGDAFTQFDYGSGTGTSDVVSIVRATCDGSFSFMATEKYSIGVGVNASYLIQAFTTLLLNTQNCRFSVPLTLNQFRAAWEMWTGDYWGYLFTYPTPAPFTTRSSWLSLFDSVSSRITLPTTCTLATWQQTGVCALKWTGLQDLLNVDITIRARMRRCTANPEGIPEMYIECEGTDCANLFRPILCTADDQCSPDLVCKDLTSDSSLTYNNYNPLGLLLWGESSNAYANCPYQALETIPDTETCSTSLSSYYEMLREAVLAITGSTSTVSSGFSICTVDYDAVKDNGADWANGLIINSGADFSVKGMEVWDDAFSEPDPAATGSSGTTGAGTGAGTGTTGAGAGAGAGTGTTGTGKGAGTGTGGKSSDTTGSADDNFSGAITCSTNNLLSTSDMLEKDN